MNRFLVEAGEDAVSVVEASGDKGVENGLCVTVLIDVFPSYTV